MKAGPSGATVRIRDVCVRYPGADRNSVDGASLEVPAGELAVLLGPSGCGKSTLLRTVNRLVVPARGTVEVDGKDVARAAPEALRRGIGYVIQAVGLFPHLTVARNVAVVPELLGWEGARIAQRVDELLGLVQLEPERYRDRFPHELSGGEQQRVGVARALAAEPRVLLMDEPFGAVDALVRLALQDETLAIHRALGTTILFVTHDVDEALRIADRIVVMQAGRIVQADTPLRILARPATPYVEQLLDARDAVRRLALLRVRDAFVRAANGSLPALPTIEAGRSLREALSVLLEGAERIAVLEDGLVAGTLGFDDVRSAIAATER
ncbi:MAG: ABC transporter ATP-binding protein [Candidatus Baltobacteraceae bacterium]